MLTTSNHGLRKPEYSDNADIADINYNTDKIDNMPVLYRAASEPTNKVPGKTLWQDTTNGLLKLWNGTSWETIAVNSAIKEVSDDTSPSLGGNLDAADYIIGRPVIKDYAQAVKAHGTTGGSITCNLEDGNIHTITLNAATTFTFSNPPISGKAGSLTLIINQGTTAYAIKWPLSVRWDKGIAPNLSQAGVDWVLVFLTMNGGTTWRGWLFGSEQERIPVYVGAADGIVRKLNLSDGSVIWASAAFSINAWGLACDPYGYVYVGTDDGKVRKLNPSTGAVIWTSAGFGNYAYGLACDSDGYVYVGVYDGYVRKLDPSDGAVIWISTEFSSKAHGLACDPDGYIYAGADDGKVRKLNPSTGAAIWTSTDFGSNAHGLACDSDGYVYVGTYDGIVRKLNPSTGAVIWTSAGFGNYAYGLACDPDGYIYAGADDGKVRKLNPSTGAVIWTSADFGSNAHGLTTNYYAGWGM